uniref:NADH-ubiquinone oxidoreductase chain 6 n=1 Tax=Benthonectes filipes TaxID=649367 RepID=A0A345WJC6_9EUCA|nr:NADH dehydrogenase subunit 6 [Benthonectes filipes]AXJ93169.1 NADH dehydrogenase subunit 6 [Benthonectes filipes]
MSLIIILSPIIIASSLLFTRLMHPLAMGLSLLVQTVMVCVTAGLSMNSFWFSYILFLIFLGAMLVLFIYVASLASNETFSFSGSLFIVTAGTFFLALIFFFMDPLALNAPTFISHSSISMDSVFSSTPSLLSSIYNNTTMSLTLFIVLYLLLTLIAVVKITNTFFGPLRLSF